MHMYFRLRATLRKERAAMDKLREYHETNARVHQVDERNYVLLVPAGRRPESVAKYLRRKNSHDGWDLVGWDDDDGVVDLPADDWLDDAANGGR